jgi:CheY-like chemotaxis protein
MRPRDGDSYSLPTADQLATLRAVLGRVGHDLSNLVTPLVAYPPLLRMDMPVGSKSGELIDAMEQTAQDIVGVARQMLDFSACGEFERQPVELGEVVRMVSSELAKSLPAGIRAHVEVRDEGLTISGSHEKLGRCLRRLWANAVESMPAGGEVTVSVARMESASPLRTPGGGEAPAGAYGVIEVRDTGSGIDPAVLPSVFIPFFTTRRDRRKRGAGLGLTYVHAITQAHGGYVDLDSKLGEGTGVRMLFPLSDAATAPTSAATRLSPAAASPEVRRSADFGRILVVDDESSIRESFSMLLKSALPGVLVDLAANGEEALAMFGEGWPAVVVMDLYMPIKDGYSAFMDMRELARRESRQMPAVVFCTGYAPPRTIREIVSTDQRHVLLPKPVSARELVDAVKARLTL